MTRIESIKARLAAATPGPWSVTEDVTGHLHVDSGYRGPASDYIPVADIRQVRSDADLIAHTPADLRLLLELAETVKIYFRNHSPCFVGDIGEKCAEDTNVRTILTKLDAPVGDDGAE